MSAEIRLLFSEKNQSRRILDANTSQPPYWLRGNDLVLSAAFELADGSFLTASAVGSIEFVIRDETDDEAQPKRMTETVGSSDCDPDFGAGDWESGGELVQASWTAAEAALEVPVGADRRRYLIYATHTDPSGDKTTFGAYHIEVRLAPHATATLLPPDPPEEQPLTEAQGDARYPLIADVVLRTQKASVTVADAGARGSQAPDFVGQYLYQQDTELWYEADSMAVGDFSLVASWAVAGNYVAEDIRQANGLLWEALDTHNSAPTWSEPGAGYGWQKHWKPWAVEGFHFTVDDDTHEGMAGTIKIGRASLLPDWTYLLNWLTHQTQWLGSSQGNGEEDTRWIDGTPLVAAASANSARAWASGVYTPTAGPSSWAHHNNVWYRCVATTPGVDGEDEPGVGTDWDDYWIVWAEDRRSIGVYLMGVGTYFVSETWKVPPGQSVYGHKGRNRCWVKASTAMDYVVEHTYKSRAGSSYKGTANFYSSWVDVGLDGNNLSNGMLLIGSHGSKFRAEARNYAHKNPLVVGELCDDIEIELQYTDTLPVHTRSPFAIYVGNGALNLRFHNCILGPAGVGISFQDVTGTTVLNAEAEGVALPFETRRRESDDFYTRSWSTTAKYYIGDGLVHGVRYRVYNQTPLLWSAGTYTSGKLVAHNGTWYQATATTTDEPGVTAGWENNWDVVRLQSTIEPGVGADWEKYFWDEEATPPGFRNGTGAGRCGGLTIIGGHYSRYTDDSIQPDTIDAFALVRYDEANGYDSFRLIGVHLTCNDVAAGNTWTHVASQNTSFPGEIHDYPLTENIEHGKDRLSVDLDLRRDLQLNAHIRREAEYPTTSGAPSGAFSPAITVDGRLVGFDNPPTFVADGNEDVLLTRGFYEVEVVFNSGTGTITIDDPDGNPLPGMAAITANSVFYYLHSLGTLNVALSGSAGTPSIDVYVKPRRFH